tara:strand:- start:1468 stop:3735 length:2268 start_codon:yes stop_codon:yes gene_type:complete
MAKNIVSYILDVSTGKAKKEVKSLDRSVDFLEKELKQTTAAASNMGNRAAKSFGKMKAAIGAVGVAVFASTLARAAEASFKFTHNVVDTVNELNDLRNVTGLSSQSIQGIIQAFEGAGLSAGSAEAFLRRFPKTLADITKEGTEASRAAKAFGISVFDANGEIRSADAILSEVTKTFQNIEDRTLRNAAAFRFFGRSASTFSQALGETANYEKFINFSREFGVVAGEGTDKLNKISSAAGAFQETFSALGIVVKGAKQQIDLAFNLTERFTEAMISTASAVVFVSTVLTNATNSFSALGFVIKQTISNLFDFAINTNKVTGALFTTLNLLQKTDVGKSLIQNTKQTTIEFFDLENALKLAEERSKAVRVAIRDLNSGLTRNSKEADQATESAKKLIGAQDDLADSSGKFSSGENKINEILNQTTSELMRAKGPIEALNFEYNQLIRDINNLDLSPQQEFLRDLAKFQAGEVLLQNLKEIGDQKAFEIQQEQAQKAKEQFDKLNNSINGSIDALSALTSGDFISGLQKIAQLLPGNIGRIANISASVLGVAQSIGQAGSGTQAIQNIEEQAEAQIRAIKIGLQVLPEILINVLPKFALMFAQEIAIALFKLPSEIAKAIKEAIDTRSGTEGGLGAVLTKEGREARSDLILLRLSKIFQGFKLESGGRIPSAQSGLRFTGNTTGLALLHPNEYVVPASGQMPQNVNRDFGAQMGGSGMTININAHVVQESAIDELVRQIENRFVNFGGNRSTLFQGS